MTSPKEKWRQLSDYEILLIKGGWLVAKSNRPLPFVNQENRKGVGWGAKSSSPPPHPHDHEGKKTMTSRVKLNLIWWLIPNFIIFLSDSSLHIVYKRLQCSLIKKKDITHKHHSEEIFSQCGHYYSIFYASIFNKYHAEL